METPGRFPGLRRHFMFFDDTGCASMSLLYRNNVRIRPRRIARQQGGKYRIVFCDVRKKDVPMFVKSMEELKNKMLLIGNTDYEAFCESTMALLAAEEPPKRPLPQE